MEAYSPNLDADLAAFAIGALGGGLSPQVESLIQEAGLLRHLPAQALLLLERARSAAPRHPAPLIALYRFYFYAHRWSQARAVGVDAMAIARTVLGPDFGDWPPSDDAVRHDAAVRFYLFALKGLAYLNLRLNDMDETRMLLGELRRLDPQDHVGGGLLSHVLKRYEKDADPDAPSDYPVRGWSAPAP